MRILKFGLLFVFLSVYSGLVVAPYVVPPWAARRADQEMLAQGYPFKITVSRAFWDDDRRVYDFSSRMCYFRKFSKEVVADRSERRFKGNPIPFSIDVVHTIVRVEEGVYREHDGLCGFDSASFTIQNPGESRDTSVVLEDLQTGTRLF